MDHLAPVCYLQRILGQKEAIAFELSAASNGGVAGIEVIGRLLSSDPTSRAGLIAATSSWPDETSRQTNGTIMGDGAAAAVISTKQGFARLLASARTCQPEIEVLLRKSLAQSGGLDVGLSDIEGASRFAETIVQESSAAIYSALAEAEIKLDDISHFLLPGFPPVVLEQLYLARHGVSIEKTCWSELQKTGHVGPSDQLLGLSHLLNTNQLKSGQLVLMLGVGLGFRFTTLLFEIT
ncbi:3-oxoacyl-[acyl-carrier-protein] synthase III C-terminal domain-containing protein [Mycobacterium simulans]|uniref:3-oxoacyl-[acyl-carrier-protein] synthase III C-terminal domain-containing protein n=1 Tax=Mycobacterium simulans TaxID=627089 RepID=UPI00174B5CE7|nr:3-oxoacyl-[acyl-carrier-protein] synthase III C-terminal domain-containing protein [Mycobacterium simulans]